MNGGNKGEPNQIPGTWKGTKQKLQQSRSGIFHHLQNKDW